MNSTKESTANAEAFRRLVESRPILTGMARAGEVIPGMKPNTVLHSGPEIEFAAMRGAHRQGIVGALLFEGIARDEKEAVGMIEAGEIDIRAANDFNSGAPGSGITSSSMAVLVVEEKTSGIRAFAPPIEGAQGGGVLVHIRFHDVVGDEMGEFFHPEQGKLVQDDALPRNGIAEDDIEGGHAVGGDDEQRLFINVVDVAHLAAAAHAETGQAGGGDDGIGQRLHGMRPRKAG